MTNHYEKRKVAVIGHKHPDTDSVCSAIAYAWLKNRTSEVLHEPCCAGAINRETEFALRYFDASPPKVCEDVSPQLKDIAFRLQPGIPPETSILDVWNLMRDEEINTLCVTDLHDHLLGLISLKDLANANMDLLDASVLSAAATPYRNIIQTLKGTLVCGNADNHITQGRVCIGTSPEKMRAGISPGDLVLVADQIEIQLCAISCGASCLIICCSAVPSSVVLALAQKYHCTVITTAFDTYQAARLISTATPVRHLMVSQNLLTFRMDTPLEDVRNTMAHVRFQYFPVLDNDNQYCGVVSRRNLLNLKRKQLILVDHNEKNQAVEGLEEAEILEIIDHHRLGALETDAPVVFRNLPVGCTATIVYQLFKEQNIIPPAQIAGLMLSAILSDTLMFRSPTATVFDKDAAYALAETAGVCLEEYADQMFEAGSDLTGKTAEDILFADFKVFHFGEQKIGIGQACLMTENACTAAEELLVPYLEKAREKADVPMLLFMLTNTPNQNTRVLFRGKNASTLLAEAFSQKCNTLYIDLPGVVSRKKQLLPALKKVMK